MLTRLVILALVVLSAHAGDRVGGGEKGECESMGDFMQLSKMMMGDKEGHEGGKGDRPADGGMDGKATANDVSSLGGSGSTPSTIAGGRRLLGAHDMSPKMERCKRCMEKHMKEMKSEPEPEPAPAGRRLLESHAAEPAPRVDGGDGGHDDHDKDGDDDHDKKMMMRLGKCMSAKQQKCMKEIGDMDEKGEKGEKGEHASHDGHDHADGEHASGRRLLAAHEAKCTEEFGSDVAKIAECVAKASATVKAAGDLGGLLKGAKDGAGAGGEGMKEKAMAMGEKVKKGMKGAGGGMGGGMGKAMESLFSSMGATLSEDMKKKMQEEMSKASGMLKNMMKKVPSCDPSDMKGGMKEAFDEMGAPIVTMLKDAGGMSEEDAKKQATLFTDSMMTEAFVEVPAGGKTGGGDMTKEGSPTPPVATQTASPLATTTSGSGAVALSLGAVLVALLGLVQI